MWSDDVPGAGSVENGEGRLAPGAALRGHGAWGGPWEPDGAGARARPLRVAAGDAGSRVNAAAAAGAQGSGQRVPRNPQDTEDRDVSQTARCGSRRESRWPVH